MNKDSVMYNHLIDYMTYSLTETFIINFYYQVKYFDTKFNNFTCQNYNNLLSIFIVFFFWQGSNSHPKQLPRI